MTGRLVVGVDGSPASEAAAVWAGQEAALWGTAVRLVNVWRPPASNVQFSPDPEGWRLWEESRLRDAAEGIRRLYPGLAVTAQQISGSPVKMLLDEAAAADMLVLGSRRIGAMTRFLAGSVSLPVLVHCERPVVLVRAADDAGGVSGPDVVVGVDLDAPVDSLIAFALAEAQVRMATLRVVHVHDVRRAYGYAAPALDPELAGAMRAHKDAALARLLAPWRNGPDGERIVPEVTAGSAAPTLVSAAEGASLLVVGRRRKPLPLGSRIGPVAHGVVHHAACPVAVVAHD